MTRISAAEALPASPAARRAFERASASFDRSCVVHDTTRDKLLERLSFVRLKPQRVLDLGCATGAGAAALAARYPAARVLALDASVAMLRLARGRKLARANCVAGDAERLPLRSNSLDLILANLCLPWCRPEPVLEEAARVLAEGGLLLFATLGPDTLREVRSAWAAVDRRIHVHGFFDMHDLGDLSLAAGLAEPVMDVDRLELTYNDLRSMVEDLRACGASNVAAGRHRGLTAPGRWAEFERQLLAGRHGRRLSLTVELIFGQAWGTGAARTVDGGGAEIAVPIGRIKRPQRP